MMLDSIKAVFAETFVDDDREPVLTFHMFGSDWILLAPEWGLWKQLILVRPQSVDPSPNESALVFGKRCFSSQSELPVEESTEGLRSSSPSSLTSVCTFITFE